MQKSSNTEIPGNRRYLDPSSKSKTPSIAEKMTTHRVYSCEQYEQTIHSVYSFKGMDHSAFLPSAFHSYLALRSACLPTSDLCNTVAHHKAQLPFPSCPPCLRVAGLSYSHPSQSSNGGGGGIRLCEGSTELRPGRQQMEYVTEGGEGGRTQGVCKGDTNPIPSLSATPLLPSSFRSTAMHPIKYDV